VPHSATHVRAPTGAAADERTPEALANLLQLRAAAQLAGLSELEKDLRDRIRDALPMHKIESDGREPVSKAPPETALDEARLGEDAPSVVVPIQSRMAQLATLPSSEGRRSERRVVNLAADLRESGACVAEVEVTDISEDGFMMRSDAGLDFEIGSFAWLKLPGFEAFKSQVIWIKDGRLGARFLTPLYPAILALILKPEPRSKPRRLFGPAGIAA
jgi:hypothetical protein